MRRSENSARRVKKCVKIPPGQVQVQERRRKAGLRGFVSRRIATLGRRVTPKAFRVLFFIPIVPRSTEFVRSFVRRLFSPREFPGPKSGKRRLPRIRGVRPSREGKKRWPKGERNAGAV